MERILHENRLKLLKTQEPLTFVYKKSCESPDSHSLHINNYVEVFIYISGDVDYIVGESYYTLKEGDIILINPHEVHKAVVRSTAVYERFYILIPVDAFCGLTFDPLQKILDRPENASAVVSLSASEWSIIKPLLYSIDRLAFDGGDSEHLEAYGKIIELMCTVDSCGQTAKNEQTRNVGQLPLLIKDALGYIDRNLTEIPSVADIADSLHVTLPYLSSQFKAHIGVNINSYIRMRRVAYAKRLLDDGATVTEACFDSGFSDCSYFIKCFKQHIGTTPLKYSQSRRRL